MIRLCEGEVYVFFRVVQAARDVVEVDMNCNRVVEMDSTIALKRNWSCLSKRIWSRLGEGDATSGRVINVGGDDFEPLAKPSE